MLKEFEKSIYAETYFNVESLLWKRENYCINIYQYGNKAVYLILARGVLSKNKMFKL